MVRVHSSFPAGLAFTVQFPLLTVNEDHKLVTLSDPANGHLLFESASGILQEDKIIYNNPHFFQFHLELFLHHRRGPFYMTASVLSADEVETLWLCMPGRGWGHRDIMSFRAKQVRFESGSAR